MNSIPKPKSCPDCPDQGWYMEHDGMQDVQVLCEFCFKQGSVFKAELNAHRKEAAGVTF